MYTHDRAVVNYSAGVSCRNYVHNSRRTRSGENITSNILRHIVRTPSRSLAVLPRISFVLRFTYTQTRSTPTTSLLFVNAFSQRKTSYTRQNVRRFVFLLPTKKPRPQSNLVRLRSLVAPSSGNPFSSRVGKPQYPGVFVPRR